MPRIRQLSGQYAEEDFLKEIKIRMIEVGIRSDRELAEAMGLCPSSLCKRKKNITDISVAELQGFVRILFPDPTIVLRLAGYSAKDIQAYRKAAADNR